MTVIERRERILEILRERRRITIDELAEILNVSSVTVRRDVKSLEREGKVLRSRGVVILPRASIYELSFKERERENVVFKVRIAREALKLIEEGMVLGFDASTTTLQIAKLIVEGKVKVTVVTNGLPIFNILAASQEADVILAGGQYDPKNLSFNGPLTNRFLDMFSFDICFVGASSIVPERGIFTVDAVGAETIRHFAKNSRKVVCVADSSKFSKHAQFLTLTMDEVDVIITDENVGTDIIGKVPTKVKVVVAG